MMGQNVLFAFYQLDINLDIPEKRKQQLRNGPIKLDSK